MAETILLERAFIAIGSNIVPERNLPLAVKHLSTIGDVVAVSHVYQNPAVGLLPQPDFLNAAVLVETELAPLEVRRRLRAIEGELGRVRQRDAHAARTIDLDLCLYGSLVLSVPELTLPDAGITERAFLAVPLAELAPGFLHPVVGASLADLAARLRGDAALVRRSDVGLPIASTTRRAGGRG